METFEQLVFKAREHLEEIEFRKAQIAALALKVCEIKTGRPSGGSYTIREFAESIEVNYQTLMSWVRIYRDVCIPIGLINPSDKEWKQASAAHRKVVEVSSGKNSTVTMHGGQAPISPNYKEFQKAFMDQDYGKNDVFSGVYRELRAIYNRIEKLDLGTQDPSVLNSSMVLMDKISDIINDHLTKSKKKAR